MPRARATWFGRGGDRDSRALMAHPADPHFFRHEYGRLVAMISRRVGMHRLQLVEDAAQSALLAALESWGLNGPPDNPSSPRTLRLHSFQETCAMTFCVCCSCAATLPSRSSPSWYSR